MKNPFNSQAPFIDARAITATIERALNSAGLDTTSGPMRNVTETISRALGAGAPDPLASSVLDDSIVDTTARFVDDDGAAETATAASRPSTFRAHPPAANFTAHQFGSSAGKRAYKLYVPATPSDQPRPLLVMLHGCTQSADDFAAGTQMNRLADEHGLLVVYPEQAPHANQSKCWNWFQSGDQVRERGEPSLIAGIVGEVAARHGADPRRIFVAGLSAGAAMAVILGETYPEVFAAVGAHSGLPYGSAHDIPSAMAAMKGGRSGIKGLKNLPAPPPGQRKAAVNAVPTIVFHGDRDHTVQQTNGIQIVRQAEAAHRLQQGGATLRTTTQRGAAPGGRQFSRTVHADEAGRALIEHWCIHGAGHAWSGGHSSGTYTDVSGPNASAEMLRFFMATDRAGTA